MSSLDQLQFDYIRQRGNCSPGPPRCIGSGAPRLAACGSKPLLAQLSYAGSVVTLTRCLHLISFNSTTPASVATALQARPAASGPALQGSPRADRNPFSP